MEILMNSYKGKKIENFDITSRKQFHRIIENVIFKKEDVNLKNNLI